RLRLAVGDGHLVAVHALGDGAHDFDGAGGSGHDAGAQGGEIEAVELGVDELGDEHGGRAVDGGGARAVHGFQGGADVELGRGQDERGAGDHGDHGGDHAAETVVEGHGDRKSTRLNS